ncbi:hypothetical protein JTE90_021869 [Oedothorax gibbosus]|uniref:Uncharacterized protein n=1 Tax=Oedothorax gibbosus TaxID=931172 RepID=A0AAV6UYE5_9ARAC|nr:hypothetical protein JTE90_021869 [Oedothorax gibbosus]
MLYLSISWHLVVFITFTTVTSLRYECPEPEDVFPCYCEEEDNDPTIYCNHFHQPQQIYNAVKGLKGHRIYKMSFFMNWILDEVKTDAFKDIAVDRILFENSTISLTSPQFAGMENHLVGIQMRACFNKTNPMGTWSLGHLTKLTELTMDKNRILTLPDEWLTSAPDSLKTLSLEGNSIVTLEDNVFAKAKSVVFLILDDNRLTELKRSMFPKPALTLRSLSLNNNRLRYLTSDIFHDMPNLRIIEVINNRFTTLEEKVWSDMWSQLTKLDFADNPLECYRSMKWMYSDGRSKPIILYGECQEPEKLKGKSLKALQITDFN